MAQGRSLSRPLAQQFADPSEPGRTDPRRRQSEGTHQPSGPAEAMHRLHQATADAINDLVDGKDTGAMGRLERYFIPRRTR